MDIISYDFLSASVLIIAGLGLTAGICRQFGAITASYFWPSIDAVIRSCEFGDYPAHRRGDSIGVAAVQMVYIARVTAVYHVAGHDYEARMEDRSTDLQQTQYKIREIYRAGTTLKVFYNPRLPRKYVWAKDRSLWNVILYFLLMAVSLYLIFWGLSFILPQFLPYRLTFLSGRGFIVTQVL